jgi:hypothetical protein
VTSADGAREAGAGSLAEEASALFAAVQDWARRSGQGATGPDGSPGRAPAECQICPVCQLLRLIRTARPEAFEHLADAAASLAAAVREVVVAHEHNWAARPASGVQHIDIG